MYPPALFRYENIGGKQFVGGKTIGNGYEVSFGVDGVNTIVMQSTRLKDRTGKMIFEGDIVIVHGNKHTAKEVKFGLQSCDCCQAVWGFYAGEGFGCLYLENEDIEVVGNVYENPNLLSSENKP